MDSSTHGQDADRLKAAVYENFIDVSDKVDLMRCALAIFPPQPELAAGDVRTDLRAWIACLLVSSAAR